MSPHRGRMVTVLLGTLLLLAPAVSGAGCPNGYTQFEESCYFHHHQKMTFIKASVYCRQHQGHLTEIETAEEGVFVKAFLKEKIISNGVWLGANDIRFEGYYVWDKSENPLNYTDWYPGEPNQKTDEQDCMSSWKSEGYQWADHYCNHPDLEPLCETEVTKCS
ncbi:perlucin-like [Haliotis rubra]|uniref:perlucin-like n=1 Tax=Haliotis rubra TaxID=36100 RepID=UPI001EE5F8FA|nr:perlucin-like [Haliotis rubra]